ncbi:hypothetical protein Nmel_011194 [Mimus melanotis]
MKELQQIFLWALRNNIFKIFLFQHML